MTWPQPVDQPRGVNRPIGVQQKDGEQDPLFGGTEANRAVAVATDFEGAEYSESHEPSRSGLPIA
jgi:hypothetical protein